MTTINQDFTIYAGDAAIINFTVLNAAGAPIDISGVSDIIWNMQRDLQSAVVLQVTKTGGGISFVTNGTDGQFKVSLLGSQTAPLTGFYMHQAQIVDAMSPPNVTTVALGRADIGRMPAATYSGDPTTSDKDSVRFWIDDRGEFNNVSSKIHFELNDQEILYALTQYPNPLLAAAACARSLAARFAKLVDKTLGPLKLNYGQRYKAFIDVAERLQAMGEQDGVAIYAGGTSKSDMCAVDSNSDRVPPPFSIKQFDIPNAANPVTTDPDNQFNPVP